VHVSSEECLGKECKLTTLKRIASRCFRSVQNKMQESILSEIDNSISSSPEQCTRKRKGQRIVTRRDSNGRFRKELS